MNLDLFTSLSEIDSAEERLSFLKSLSAREDLRYPGVHEWYAYRLYLEAIDNFVRGNNLTTVIIGHAFVENTLGAILRKRCSERTTAYEIIQEAVEEGILTESKAETLQRVRKLRNPVAHPRSFADEDSYFHRYTLEDKSPAELAQEDAEEAMKAVFVLVNSFYEE